MNESIYKTKYASMTTSEFIAFVEHLDTTNHFGPLAIELLERLKQLHDKDVDDGK